MKARPKKRRIVGAKKKNKKKKKKKAEKGSTDTSRPLPEAFLDKETRPRASLKEVSSS